MWEYLGIFYYKSQCIFFSFSFILTLCFTLFDWTSCSTKNHYLGFGCLVYFEVHLVYDDWTWSFMEDSSNFFVYIYNLWSWLKLIFGKN